MKICFSNIIDTVTATAEDSGFPAENLLEAHSKKRFKAGATSTTLSLTMGAGSNCLALYNVTADSVTATIAGAVLDETKDLTRDDGYGEYNATCCFFEYTAQAAAHTCEVDISHGSEDVACGVAFGGVAYDFTNPQWGLGQNPKSYSIIYDLDNGFDYTFQRNLAEHPNLRWMITDRDEYWNLMRLLKTNFPNPAIFKADNMGADETNNLIWYARLLNEPKGALTSYGKYNITCQLKEYL